MEAHSRSLTNILRRADFRGSQIVQLPCAVLRPDTQGDPQAGEGRVRKQKAVRACQTGDAKLNAACS